MAPDTQTIDAPVAASEARSGETATAGAETILDVRDDTPALELPTMGDLEALQTELDEIDLTLAQLDSE